MQGAQGEQFLAEGVDLSFQTEDGGGRVHVRYAISHICHRQGRNTRRPLMTEDDLAAWLCEQASAVLQKPSDMGAIEKALDRVSLECRRRALERLVQQQAERQDFQCPRCGAALLVQARHRRREVASCFGAISFTRGYGFCPDCDEHFYPADAVLGLQARAPASPRVQEICALTALRAPAGQAQEDVRRLTGIDLDASTLHREARRQGERALVRRDDDEQRTQTLAGVAQLSSRAVGMPSAFTLVIEIDAWNIRERDHWGQTQALRDAGQDAGRWHWVYTATIFRLDQRATTASGRPIITQRGYVATRRGLESFQRQLYAEALQRGLTTAQLVLILGDGALWIWNIAADRFKEARQRVDLHHVREHLWSLAHQLHGEGTAAAKDWVRPFLQSLEQRNGAVEVIESLEQLHLTLGKITHAQRQAIDREINYFQEHKHRMDYHHGKALGQPVGSGAIESTCSQYQRRFKLTGQFWSLSGDEAFLALSTLHRNGRWNQIFPHDDP